MGKRDTGKRDEAHTRRQAIIDGMLADALRPAYTYRLPSHATLPPDIRRAIDALLAKADAQSRRSLTYDDLEEVLPPRDVSAEDLEAIFWVLAEHGIEVEDGQGG